jgi:hypothetical protein
MVLLLLSVFFVVDTVLYKKEGRPAIEGTGRLGLEGSFNFLLLLGVVGLVLLSGLWRSEGRIVIWADVTYLYSDLVRDLGLLGLTFLTVALTPKTTRQGNHFTWGPIAEVAKIFGGIFITMIPAIAILRAGEHGALSSLISMVTGPDGAPVDAAYFWLTGALSSFLDNAPTYLVFFNTAGGDAQTLMNVIPQTLSAISCGAVFMGANSYIGNAPNFMVRSISEERGVKMPSFFGYLVSHVRADPCRAVAQDSFNRVCQRSVYPFRQRPHLVEFGVQSIFERNHLLELPFHRVLVELEDQQQVEEAVDVPHANCVCYPVDFEFFLAGERAFEDFPGQSGYLSIRFRHSPPPFSESAPNSFIFPNIS